MLNIKNIYYSQDLLPFCNGSSSRRGKRRTLTKEKVSDPLDRHRRPTLTLTSSPTPLATVSTTKNSISTRVDDGDKRVPLLQHPANSVPSVDAVSPKSTKIQLRWKTRLEYSASQNETDPELM